VSVASLPTTLGLPSDHASGVMRILPALVRVASLTSAGTTPIGGSMADETPVLDTLADMTAASLVRNSLAPRELMLVRIAALIAVDAAPASYLMNAGAAEESGVTADDIQGVMIGIAPVVGAPRVVSAGGNILRALGLAIAVAESELADIDAEQ
jgi:alkylhydroperoxidase/carboxymuconolactone decarboxylase family protein YurZ